MLRVCSRLVSDSGCRQIFGIEEDKMPGGDELLLLPGCFYVKGLACLWAVSLE